MNAQTEGPELQDSRVYVVRVYYANEKDIQKLIPFDLFEFNDKVDKYVLVAATQWEIERIKALGFKVVVDDERSADLALGYGNQIQDHSRLLLLPNGRRNLRDGSESGATTPHLPSG